MWIEISFLCLLLFFFSNKKDPSLSSALRAGMSLSSIMLKDSPARGFFPGPHPYLFPGTHGHPHPLKSLGRLVLDTSLPLGLPGGAFLNPSGPALHEHAMLSAFPYNPSQMLAGHALLSKPEELAAVVTEHAAGPLSADFSSPASGRSSSSSSSSAKENLLGLPGAHLSPEKKRTSYNFSEDDLFLVLYGYSGGRERSVGHAVSGVSLPGNQGDPIRSISVKNTQTHQFDYK